MTLSEYFAKVNFFGFGHLGYLKASMAKRPVSHLAIAWSRQIVQRRTCKVASGQDCQEQKQLLCRGGPADQDEHVKVETRFQQNPRGDSQGYIGQELQQLKQVACCRRST